MYKYKEKKLLTIIVFLCTEHKQNTIKRKQMDFFKKIKLTPYFIANISMLPQRDHSSFNCVICVFLNPKITLEHSLCNLIEPNVPGC